MKSNKEIAKYFQDLGNIMELHKDNPFKIRSYKNAYLTIRKLNAPLSSMTEAEILEIKGVGKNIANKISEILSTGEMATLNKFKEKTPLGVQEMLQLKGFGAKKIYTVWKDLGAESIGELLYACNENRLIELKGFGAKTQEQLIKTLNYFIESRGRMHYARAQEKANEIKATISKKIPGIQISEIGGLRRKNIIVDQLEFLVAQKDLQDIFDDTLVLEKQSDHKYKCVLDTVSFEITTCNEKEYINQLFELTGPSEFTSAFKLADNYDSEEAIFKANKAAFVPTEVRDIPEIANKSSLVEGLIKLSDIKGVIHNHSTYSDGINTLEEMAQACHDEGYEYLVMSDHSKSAVYANGLQTERVYQQMEEIDALNEKMAPFKVFKSIESDILVSGALDYEEEVLKSFDLVIASVHSSLKMDKEKATKRIITAVENPYTTILGHPSGRLLLARKGYDLDYRKVIDACAANNVVIELNANPYRLDLDPEWIPYAMEKGVLISINPDAHSVGGIKDIKYGVLAARKGGLQKSSCFCALNLTEFSSFINA
jgi:DNA polymerase (family 10)